MDKKNLLVYIAQKIRNGELTKEEILKVIEEQDATSDRAQLDKQSKISDILYYIGGAIVFIGICTFIGTNWSSLGNVTKIIATLGSSVMMYVAGTLLLPYKDFSRMADAFYFIAALIAPLGLSITMDIAGMDVDTAGSHSFIAGTALTVNLLYYLVTKRNVFYVFIVIFGTWLFFGITTTMIGGRPFRDWDFIQYRWLAVGLTHMFLGYANKDEGREALTRYLYGFGVFEFLAAALCLGGYASSQNVFWELAFPGFSFGVIYLSVYLRERSFLLFGVIFLMIYILKITNEYFTTGFGWSLSLIFAGFTLMALGYFAFYLNKKYLSE